MDFHLVRFLLLIYDEGHAVQFDHDRRRRWSGHMVGGVYGAGSGHELCTEVQGQRVAGPTGCRTGVRLKQGGYR